MERRSYISMAYNCPIYRWGSLDISYFYRSHTLVNEITTDEVTMILQSRIDAYNSQFESMNHFILTRDGVGRVSVSQEINRLRAEVGTLGELLDDIEILSRTMFSSYHLELTNERDRKKKDD